MFFICWITFQFQELKCGDQEKNKKIFPPKCNVFICPSELFLSLTCYGVLHKLDTKNDDASTRSLHWTFNTVIVFSFFHFSKSKCGGKVGNLMQHLKKKPYLCVLLCLLLKGQTIQKPFPCNFKLFSTMLWVYRNWYPFSFQTDLIFCQSWLSNVHNSCQRRNFLSSASQFWLSFYWASTKFNLEHYLYYRCLRSFSRP